MLKTVPTDVMSGEWQKIVWVEGMPSPKTRRNSLPDKGWAINGLVDCNGWDIHRAFVPA